MTQKGTKELKSVDFGKGSPADNGVTRAIAIPNVDELHLAEHNNFQSGLICLHQDVVLFSSAARLDAVAPLAVE